MQQQCLRHVLVEDLFPIQIRCPSCRFLSGHSQLVFLVGAATVDLVFDIVPSTKCFRAVPDNLSRSFVPPIVGNRQLGVLNGSAAVNLVLNISTSKTCSQYRLAVISAGSCRAMVSCWFWKVLQPSISSLTSHPRRPASELLPTTFHGLSCRSFSGNC